MEPTNERKYGCSSFVKKEEIVENRKGACGSTKAKLNGMIRWMQETGPVLQEFVGAPIKKYSLGKGKEPMEQRRFRPLDDSNED
ncbi:hypothetical protein J1N35_011254 [Gossypium stocksii]|uniref:Uncharacterized protein n=1 Tax=Gossypium stocksii TaxID=47602 RepID=A0A9D3W1Y0_9ROSI|nr:hypothetical protein J1N35_011254 [Gossypium stocksii]